MEDGLICAYSFDGQGGGTALGWNDLEQALKSEQLVWIHLDYSQDRARQWIESQAQLDAIVVDNLLAEETRPRCSINRRGQLALLRGVNTNPGADPEDMVSIRLFTDGRNIITTRKRKLASISDMVRIIEDGEGPHTAGDFIAQLSEFMTNRIAYVIEDLEDSADTLSETEITHDTQEIRAQLADLKRVAIQLKRYLRPQIEALTKMSNAEAPWISQENRFWVREIVDHTVRYLEDLDALHDRLSVSEGELSHHLNQMTEKRMYLLSIITAIFLPLSFITGLLGINVGGIPGSDNGDAFLMVSGLLLVFGVIQLLLLRWLKWF